MGNRRGGLPCPPRTPPARHRSLPPAADSLRPFEQWRWGRFVLAVWRAGAGGLAGGGALLPPLSPPAFSPAPARLPAVSTRFPLPPLHKRPSLNSGGIRRPRLGFVLCCDPLRYASGDKTQHEALLTTENAGGSPAPLGLPPRADASGSRRARIGRCSFIYAYVFARWRCSSFGLCSALPSLVQRSPFGLSNNLIL